MGQVLNIVDIKNYFRMNGFYFGNPTRKITEIFNRL